VINIKIYGFDFTETQRVARKIDEILRKLQLGASQITCINCAVASDPYIEVIATELPGELLLSLVRNLKIGIYVFIANAYYQK